MKGKWVRCVKDACGDLPKSVIGRKARIISRNKIHDEMKKKAYNVIFNGWKSKKVLWEDEFVECL